MEVEKRDILIAALDYLCRNLQTLPRVLAILIQKRIITGELEEEITAGSVSYTKNKRLIDCLLRKKGAFEPFIEALRETEQFDIIEMLQQPKVKLRNDGMAQNLALASAKETETNRDGIGGSKPRPQPLPTHDNEYPMNNTPKGHVLIINNMKWPDDQTGWPGWPQFKKPYGDRFGSDCDKKKLIELFKHLNFSKPVVEDDCTREGMLNAVDDFAQNRDWRKANAAVVCILTHGDDKGILYGTDGPGPDQRSVQLLEIMSKLDPKHCPDLIGKPKLFFIQACRGNKRDNGRDGTAGPHQAEAEADDDLYFLSGEQVKEYIKATDENRDSDTGLDGPGGEEAVSHIDDYLISFATGWGYYAYRFGDATGSPYITELDRVLRENQNQDIYHVLTKVKNNVVKSRPQDKMQSPGFYTHLSKTLRL